MTRAAVGALRLESPVKVTSGCRRRTTASMSPSASAAISAPATSLWVSSATAGGADDDRPSRARGQLSGRGVADAEHRGDLTEGHCEAVVQHERDPLIRRQPLEHHHRREPGVVGGHYRRKRVVTVESRHHRFGQPFADVGFATLGRRAQPVQAQPADHRRQPRPQIGDGLRCASPTAATRPARRPRRRRRCR